MTNNAIDNSIAESPYIYYNGGVVRFIYPNMDEALESDFILSEIPPLQADHILAHGFRAVIEGINTFDIIGR